MYKVLFILVFSLSFAFGQDGRMIFKGVPILNITLLDNKAETDINKDVKFNATMIITNAGGSNYSASQLFAGNITIKGRGNWTWSLPKRPYNIVTSDSTFKKKNVPLFGMPTGSGWTLLADYEDRTALRTNFTSALSYNLGLPWCSRGLKIELYINGEYRGLYTLCEKVERDTYRVNIKDLKTTDNTGDAVTGGYTIERQDLSQIGPDEVRFQDIVSRWFSYKIPDSDKITPQQNEYMKNYWNSFMDKAVNVPVSDTVNGYRSVVYPTSFAQYYLLQDIAKNPDQNSWYFTKDKLQKINAGPGWDWGISWGNLSAYGNNNPNDTYIRNSTEWYERMMRDPYFYNLVRTTFDGAKPKINQLIADAEDYYPKLVATGAISRDSARWANIFTDASFWDYHSTYQQYVDAFLSFAKQRLYYQENTLYGIKAAKPPHTDLP